MTTTNGFLLEDADAPVEFVLGQDDDLYAVTATTGTLNVLRTRQ